MRAMFARKRSHGEHHRWIESRQHVTYRLPLLLEKSIDCHPPSEHCRFGVCRLATPEDHRMFGIAGRGCFRGVGLLFSRGV
jgi:hypothetical protein